MTEGESSLLDRGDGVRLAYQRQAGAAPAFVWLSGFRSDMAGTKAEAFAQWAASNGRAFLRFDYSGHGRSEGAFVDGTISRWLADALAVIDAKSEGPLALIGSSMGAWIALLVAKARPERVKGLLLIAPAPDFTEELIASRLTLEDRNRLFSQGQLLEPSQYSAEPNVITRALIEDGRNHFVLTQPYEFTGPVCIVQGVEDRDVPWRHALRLAKNFTGGGEVVFDLIRDGDHRLSRPRDIAELIAAAARLASRIAT